MDGLIPVLSLPPLHQYFATEVAVQGSMPSRVEEHAASLGDALPAREGVVLMGCSSQCCSCGFWAG